jgi:hypothetical protein
VQRSLSSAANFTTIATTEKGITNFTDRDIEINQQYFYRVRALNVGNASVYSQESSIIVSPLITNLPENLIGNKIKIYPNPTHEKFMLNLLEAFPNYTSKVSIEILNPLGIRIKNIEINPQNPKEIDLVSFSKGIYLLKLTHQGKTYFKKIVKY